MDKLFAYTQRQRIPLMCTFELTKNCNLHCRHCYIPHRERTQKTLSTAQIMTALDQLARMGTLYLVFTGGEIFLRKDLPALCRHARKLHFDIRLFTNGTLLTPAMAKQLARVGVSAVEISIYGKPDTHDAITGHTGSWKRSMDSIKTLQKHGLKAVIKMPLMTENYEDKKYIEALSKKLNVKLQLDAVITTMSDGNKTPLSMRLSGKTLQKIFRSHDNGTAPDAGETDLICSAGRNMLAIAANGDLLPCIQLPFKLGNITKRTIPGLWNNNKLLVKKLLSIKASDIAECKECAMVSQCQRCPGMALVEDGSLSGPSTAACLLTRARYGSKTPTNLNIRSHS